MTNVTPENDPAKNAPDDLTAGMVSEAQDVKVLRLILPFLWPKDDFRLRGLLGASFFILIAIAVLHSGAPILLAAAVDALEPKTGWQPDAIIGSLLTYGVLGLLLAYGAMHWLARCCNEMRWGLYGRIEQRIRRRVGLVVFRHLHDLSLRFHLARRTGVLSQVMDNGTRAIEDLMFDCVFLILPLLAEIIIVTNVLLFRYEGVFTVVILSTLLLYVTALIIGSEWLRKHQRRAVVVGAQAHGRAVDSLLNYETIKFSGSEDLVAERYD